MSPIDARWDDSQPIYRQLRDRVVAMVLEGALPEGEALPSVRQVAAEYRLNPLTVLKAYQQLKKAAAELSSRMEEGYAAYTPATTGPVVRNHQVAETRLANYESSVLLRMIRRRLAAVPRAVESIKARRIVSIREMTDRVLGAVSKFTRIKFHTVTEDATTRTERATAFLAVLVLIRRRMINAEQGSLFDEIELTNGDVADQDSLHDMENEFVN